MFRPLFRFLSSYSPTDPDYEYVRQNMEGFVNLDVTGEGATEELLKKVGDEYPQFMRRKIDQVEAQLNEGKLYMSHTLPENTFS